MAYRNIFGPVVATGLQQTGQGSGSTAEAAMASQHTGQALDGGGAVPQTGDGGGAVPQTGEDPAALAAEMGGTARAQAKRDGSFWDMGFREGLKTMPEKSIVDAVTSYNDYAQANGKEPLDILDMWPLMQSGDITKSVEENEKDEQKRQRREQWEQTSNVLSHLGSFIGTLFGAPAQDIEDPVELTKRQQVLRDRTLEQRRQANNDYFKIYQARQAERRAAEKEKREASYQQQNLALAQAREERQRDAQTLSELKLMWQVQYQQGLLDLRKQQQEIDEKYKMGQLSYRGKQLALNELKANYTTTKTDKEGNVTTTTHTVGSAAPAPSASTRQRKKIVY